MSALRRRKIDSTIEKRIVTGLIVSTRFLRELHQVTNTDYFQNTFTRKIADWSLNFFRQYEQAPLEHIQDIYNREKDRLKEEEAELIAKLLSEISERYEGSNEGINVDYLLDQTLSYFKKRELEITASNIQYLVERNQIEEAEDQISTFHKVQRVTSNWVNPFEIKHVLEVFEHEGTPFFQFHGQLGQFVGPIDRGWLVAVSGTFKKGKTWMLQEFAVMGIMRKLKVAFFSLEMPRKKMNERLYKRMTGFGEQDGDQPYPCFDCLRNQEGTCERSERTNVHALRNATGEKPEFDLSNPYRPCTYCRDNDIRDYRVDFWYKKASPKKFSQAEVKRKVKKYSELYSKYLRIKCYPRFSANLSDINRDLDILDQTENFQPDIIIVDYAGILKPERENLYGTEKEDETWMSLARLGGTRHALVVTANQLRRSALDKLQVKQSDTALWIGILAHVDIMLSLNQTEEEKNCGAMRVGMMVHRHYEFSEESNCYILQKLRHGQVNLDSHIKR